MWDRHNNKIEVGMILRDVRFDQQVFFKVTEVVYNTAIIGIEVHSKKYSDGWIGPYPRRLESTATFQIAPIDHVPTRAVQLLEEANL